MNQPQYCHPRAHRLFADSLPRIETTDGLLRVASAVSLHAFDDSSLEEIDRELEDLAELIREQVRSDSFHARLAHLHDVLFDQAGFVGNVEDYYSPLNSYLPTVLASRRGIPLTLSLVYKVVAERIGLRVEGLSTPGHFLVRVVGPNETMIVDPFFAGQVLSADEARHRIERIAEIPMAGDFRHFPATTHADWISRMIRNLQHVFGAQGHAEDLAAMNELQLLLQRGAPH